MKAKENFDLLAPSIPTLVSRMGRFPLNIVAMTMEMTVMLPSRHSTS